LPQGEDRVPLELVLGPASAPGADPGQGRKGVAWLELRAVVPGERAAEAKETGVFFEKLVESQDWCQGLSPRVEKQIFQAKLELRAEAQREVGLPMVEGQPEKGEAGVTG
jgi:hypothetical protein